jgi:hypothetical protein
MSVETIKTILTLVSGLCWTLVYIEGIRIGIKDRSYAIPFYALALNLSWELLHAYLGLRTMIDLQTIINVVWFLFDVGILYTYFSFGKKYFPVKFARWFVPWSILGVITAFLIEYAFVRQFGRFAGGAYAAFLQNLLMSVLFIAMLVRRGSSEGQSLTIGVSKWLGTLAPTITFGMIGGGTFSGPNSFILIVGLLCSVFDLIYIWMLARDRGQQEQVL